MTMVVCLPKRSLLYYAVDAANLIVEVGQGWEIFAEENGASGLSAIDIVGTPLSRHVTGVETREFVEEILGLVRRGGHSLIIPYRCDAPNLKRFMEMVLTPREHGVVMLSHRVLREEPSATQFKFNAGPATESVRCSMCNRLRHNGVWRDPDEALAANILRNEHSITVIYKVCDDCRRAVFGNEMGDSADFA